MDSPESPSFNNDQPERLVSSDDLEIPAEGELDRVLLRELTEQALAPGALFGRGLELTDQDRAQLRLVASKANAILEPMRSDPEWARLNQLIEEGAQKGRLISFTTHEGTNVPGWCVDGGEDVSVKKVLREGGAAGIEVPTRIYNLFHWQQTVDELDRYARQSNETLSGRMAKPLGQALYQLGHLIPPEGS